MFQMGAKAVIAFFLSLVAACLQLTQADHHPVLRVMCINATHHAIHIDDHDDDDEEDEDESEDEDEAGDEDEDVNVSNSSNASRRLTHHVNMSGNISMDDWVVMPTTDTQDPCGSPECNAVCEADSCTPMLCIVPLPENATTTPTSSGLPGTNLDGAVHNAPTSAIWLLLCVMSASLSG
mmetsp:Transcript_17732/g.32099  ORF Transcript_17732/g.32099 Transcript_17732/m.32099 type:complete len:179 (-) Transcript_17732:114-650(-)